MKTRSLVGRTPWSAPVPQDRLFLTAAFAAAVLSMTLMGQTPEQCATLHKHGDPGEAACYQGLVRSTNPAVQAEGYWALRQYHQADDAFAAAAKPAPRTRMLWFVGAVSFSKSR